MRRRYGRGICCNLTLTGSGITSHDDRCAAGLADAIGKGTGVDERDEAHGYHKGEEGGGGGLHLPGR